MNFRVRKNTRSLHTFSNRPVLVNEHAQTPSLFKNELIKQTENGLRHFNNIAQKRHVEQGKFWSFLPSTSSNPVATDESKEEFNRGQEALEVMRSQIKTRFQERRANFSLRIKQQYSPSKNQRAARPGNEEPLHNIRILGMNVDDHLRLMSIGEGIRRREHPGARVKQA